MEGTIKCCKDISSDSRLKMCGVLFFGDPRLIRSDVNTCFIRLVCLRVHIEKFFMDLFNKMDSKREV